MRRLRANQSWQGIAWRGLLNFNHRVFCHQQFRFCLATNLKAEACCRLWNVALSMVIESTSYNMSVACPQHRMHAPTRDVNVVNSLWRSRYIQLPSFVLSACCYMSIVPKQHSMKAPSRNCHIPGTSCLRYVELTVIVETTSHCAAIAPQQDSEEATSSHSCVSQAIWQGRKVALAEIVQAYSHCLTILTKHHGMEIASGSRHIAPIGRWLRNVTLTSVVLTTGRRMTVTPQQHRMGATCCGCYIMGLRRGSRRVALALRVAAKSTHVASSVQQNGVSLACGCHQNTICLQIFL
mmetsp:Transcript_136802/g.255547  ORF Transcript_136802/g.255547 Transcript_136802/m.255547 type:complete len:294 (-) Transcript_136802:123-1004(-)